MFDSGFGGLTVARALIDLLPAEDLVYIGDTGRYPYGSRPLDEVRAFAHEITARLVDVHDVKLVVVACNTASAAALDELRATCPVPVIGVIEPGVRSLVAATRNGNVGVIGTVGTIGSGAYQQAVADADADVKLTCAACPGFVEFVERGETASDQVHVLAERLLAPLRDAQIDTLLLGLHPLPLPGPYHRRRHGAGRGARRFGGRDRLQGSRPARRARPRPGSRRRPDGAGGAPPLRVLGRRDRLSHPRQPAARARARRGGARDMGLSLTVLGCAGSYPGDGVPCSGYLVRSDSTAVVLDMGHGTLPVLRRHIDLADLDAVVVTHAHPDHWVDLTAMRILTHYHLGIDGIPVWAHAGDHRDAPGRLHGREPGVRHGGPRPRAHLLDR